MKLDSILNELETDRIGFEDKISLAFMIIGGIFAVMILLSLVLNALQFEPAQFESPFL